MNISRFAYVSLSLSLLMISSSAIAKDANESKNSESKIERNKNGKENSCTKTVRLANEPEIALSSKRTKRFKFRTPMPVRPVDYNNRGVELGANKYFPEAIAHHRKAHQLDPKNKYFRTNLSSVNLQYGNYLKEKGLKNEAIARLNEAIEVDPDNKPAKKLLKQMKAK